MLFPLILLLLLMVVSAPGFGVVSMAFLELDKRIVMVFGLDEVAEVWQPLTIPCRNYTLRATNIRIMARKIEFFGRNFWFIKFKF